VLPELFLRCRCIAVNSSVTPERLRAREVGESRVRIVNLSKNKFFGFEPVDVLGYKVMISDREKTAIDCIDRPALAGGGSSC